MGTASTARGRFTWHEHRSSDPERAQRFYSELLGWGIEVWKPGEMDYAMIMSSGQSHGGFADSQGAPAHWLGLVNVDDVDGAVERAGAAGSATLAGPFDIPEVGRMAVLADPQGAVMGVFASAGEPPQGEGVFVWDELRTTDVADAKRVYGEVIGWTARDVPMGEEYTYTIFERPGGVDAAGCGPMDESPAPPHWLAYIAPDDIDTAATRAPDLGATVLMPPTDIPGIGRFAILQDPVGAVVGLYLPQAQ
jgi:predicted enzyme related to lactoylglutathione lyase